VKTSYCSSLNSSKEPNPTQSFSATGRKIRRGRAQACRCVAQGQERPANPEDESCGRRAARARASKGFGV
jgi:hypothetical protein